MATSESPHGTLERTTRSKLVLGFLCVYIVWGSTYLAIRWGVETIPPFAMGAMRFLVAGGSMYAYCRVRGAARPTLLEWRNAAIIGALLLFFGNGAVSWAEQRVSSGMASLIVATVPLWLVLCEGVMGKRPSLLKWVGVVLGLVGVGLLVLPKDGNLSHSPVDPAGAAVLALGSLTWTIGSLFSRSAVLAKPPAMAISMQMMSGGVLLSVLALVTGQFSQLATHHVTALSIASLLYLIVFGSLVGFSTYMWLLRVASPTAVGTYAYVNPVVAVLLGVLFAGEKLPPQAILATLVIVGGVALVSLSGQFRRRSPRAVSH